MFSIVGKLSAEVFFLNVVQVAKMCYLDQRCHCSGSFFYYKICKPTHIQDRTAPFYITALIFFARVSYLSKHTSEKTQGSVVIPQTNMKIKDFSGPFLADSSTF